ncbi:MAG: hypothetical protein IPJ32_11845 [Sphingobacteriaceae bacterium]|nr:hypothetical protein [Sphingobacteriaceae bacterium]
MENIRLYTDLTIRSKNGNSLKKYFDSFKKKLPEKWNCIQEKDYADTDTFKILNDVIRIQTPWYTNDHRKTTFSGGILLGLTDDSIILIKTTFSVTIQEEFIMEHLGFIIDLFHNEFLKANKSYNLFDHEFKLGGVTDDNWQRADIREARLTRLHSKADNRIYALAKGNNAKVNDKQVFYTTPNNIALSLSIMKKSFKRAKALHKNLILNRKEKKIDLKDNDKSQLYDFFEEIQACIIFAYVAVEAFTNAAIPENFKYTKTNEKGIEETWNKENIERWMQTSEKLSKILPDILKSTDIKAETFWPKFKELERVRNEIIHQKTVNKGTELNQDLYEDMLKTSIFDSVKSSLQVIEFYYNLDNAHPYFPLGMGVAKFQIMPIEDMATHFKAVED